MLLLMLLDEFSEALLGVVLELFEVVALEVSVGEEEWW